jgi:hypothetical protein
MFLMPAAEDGHGAGATPVEDARLAPWDGRLKPRLERHEVRLRGLHG